MDIPSFSLGLGIYYIVSVYSKAISSVGPKIRKIVEHTMWKWTYERRLVSTAQLLEESPTETHMVNDLVRNAAIVLQDIEILGAAGLGNLLRDGLWAYILVSYPCSPIQFRVSRDLAGLPPRSPKICNRIRSDRRHRLSSSPSSLSWVVLSTYQDLE